MNNKILLLNQFITFDSNQIFGKRCMQMEYNPKQKLTRQNENYHSFGSGVNKRKDSKEDIKNLNKKRKFEFQENIEKDQICFLTTIEKESIYNSKNSKTNSSMMIL